MRILRSKKTVKSLLNEDRMELLKTSFEKRIERSLSVISESLVKYQYPFISLSGGIHSCITAYLVHKVNNEVPAVFNDWGIMSPKNYALHFCEEFCKKYNIELVKTHSGFSLDKFTEDYGFPIFKAVRSFVPKECWNKYRITDACRKAKHICRKEFLKNFNCDLLFTGIMCDESAMRMQNYLKYGNMMPKNSDGITVCKPIIHFRQGETMDIVHKFDIHIARWANINADGKFDEYKYVKSPTLFECAFCGHDFNKRGFGKLGLMVRKEPKLFFEYWHKKGMINTFYQLSLDYPERTQLKLFIDYVEKSV